MPSGARLAFTTTHRLAPDAETDVPAARLIELLTQAEPHAVLGTCVAPGTLGLLVRPLGAAAASAPAWFLGAVDVFFFAPADPLTPIPSDRSSCSRRLFRSRLPFQVTVRPYCSPSVSPLPC